MKQRPAGVTIIAILQFIGAAFCLLGGLAFLLAGGTIAASMAAANREGGAMGSGLVGAFIGAGAIIFLIFAALWLITAIGMIKLKPWGRWMTIIFTGIAAALAVFGLVFSLLHFNIVIFVVRLIFLVIYGLILWYMFQPEVDQAFKSA